MSNISNTSNVYMDALLWLTPYNPFPLNHSGRTVLTYAFAPTSTPGNPATYYAVHDPESTVNTVVATQWQSDPSTGLWEQNATISALHAWANVANLNISSTHDFGSATFHFIATNEAGMRAYFSGEKDIQAMSTLPFDYGPNYGVPEQNYAPYTPGYTIFNQQGLGWTLAGLTPGGEGYATILHEIGHQLGLDHPWNEHGWYVDANGQPLYIDGQLAREPYFPGANNANTTAQYELDQGIYTVMSYNTDWNGQPATSLNSGRSLGPGAFDIAAVQQLYGANTTYNTGNDAYLLPQTDGPGVGWLCIWDARGNDTISAQGEAATASATIDLRAATLNPADGSGAGGYVSWINGVPGGFTIAHGVTIENAVGGRGNDTITGNDAPNVLTGGGGLDTFVFHSNFNKDIITDFNTTMDVIRIDHTLFANFAAVQAHVAEDRHGNTVITYDANDTITLQGVALSQLHASDFQFA